MNIFEPVAYRFEPPDSLPLTVRVRNEENQSTLGDVINTLREPEIKEIDAGFGGLRVTTASQTFKIGGPSFHVDVLRTFLNLEEKDKISVYSSRWYFYHRDHVTDDLHICTKTRCRNLGTPAGARS